MMRGRVHRTAPRWLRRAADLQEQLFGSVNWRPWIKTLNQELGAVFQRWNSGATVGGGASRGLTPSFLMRSERRDDTWDVHSPSAPPGTTGRAEGSRWKVIWSTISQLVSSDQRVQPGLDHLLQLPHSGKVGILTFLLLAVKNFLAIHVNF